MSWIEKMMSIMGVRILGGASRNVDNDPLVVPSGGEVVIELWLMG